MENTNQTTSPQPFNPSVPRRSYSINQWTAKEDWYTKECMKITISSSPSPADIQNAATMIDALLTVARIDYAYIQQAYEDYKLQMSIEEKRLFTELKINTPTEYSSLKLSVDEMKGVVVSTIKKTPYGNTKYNLYDLVKMSSSRNIFMKGIVELLQDKKDLLVTHNGMLKIENSLNSLQQGQQQHGQRR